MNNQFLTTTWKQLLVPIINAFGFGGTVANKKPLLVVYRDESNLKTAMLTIRMALNPGEVFNAKVAARIRREAAAYEEFLRNPRKVGWIVLYLKEFASSGSQICVSREQLRIREPLEGFSDPAEGRASFGYSFARSREKVLEFMVHDENDEPLFPLVRTYTNWTVAKELDLGLNRKFYLTLAEDAPGYINLRAGFSPVAATESLIDLVPARQQAAGAGAANIFSLREDSCPPLSPRHPAGAFALAVIMLVMFLASLAVMHQMNTPNAQAKPPASDSIYKVSREPVLPPSESESDYVGAVYSSAKLKQVPVQKKETLMRLADIRRFKVSVDRKSCNGKCLKLLNGIQRQLKTRLNTLNLPPAAPEMAAVSKRSASLVLSYMALDEERGNIHVTLSDDEGSLWDAGLEHTVNADTQISDAQITGVYSQQLSTEVLLTIFRAKNQYLLEADRTATSQEPTK